MYQLNLPTFDYKLKKADGKVWIFDVIRKKYIVLTPEEWVRQHFIHYLINDFKYPRSLVKIEGGLTYNQLQKRSDITVFDREGKPLDRPYEVLLWDTPAESSGPSTIAAPVDPAVVGIDPLALL